MVDILIIGAGPAGLTAAIYARRANKSVLILDKAAFGGQMTFSPKLENYPGYDSISGNELADLMVTQAMNQGAEVELENVVGLTSENGVHTVHTEDGNTYQARAVIVAAGAKHRHLGVKGEEKFIGDGISFCAVCDGAFYQDRTVALIGGGNSALQEALLLCETCRQVTVVQNLGFLTGEEKLQQLLAQRPNAKILLNTVVEAVDEGERFTGITVKNTQTGQTQHLSLDGMFVAIGLEPENTPFANLVDLDDRGYVAAGEDCLTRTPGVFVAGDCRTKAIRQITTATADGAVAAVAACRYCDQL